MEEMPDMQFRMDFDMKITSKNYMVRLFYFMFSVVMYNLWVVVNIFISVFLFRRNGGNPIVTTKFFCSFLLHDVP